MGSLLNLGCNCCESPCVCLCDCNPLLIDGIRITTTTTGGTGCCTLNEVLAPETLPEDYSFQDETCQKLYKAVVGFKFGTPVVMTDYRFTQDLNNTGACKKLIGGVGITCCPEWGGPDPYPTQDLSPIIRKAPRGYRMTSRFTPVAVTYLSVEVLTDRVIISTQLLTFLIHTEEICTDWFQRTWNVTVECVKYYDNTEIPPYLEACYWNLVSTPTSDWTSCNTCPTLNAYHIDVDLGEFLFNTIYENPCAFSGFRTGDNITEYCNPVNCETLAGNPNVGTVTPCDPNSYRCTREVKKMHSYTLRSKTYMLNTASGVDDWCDVMYSNVPVNLDVVTAGPIYEPVRKIVEKSCHPIADVGNCCGTSDCWISTPTIYGACTTGGSGWQTEIDRFKICCNTQMPDTGGPYGCTVGTPVPSDIVLIPVDFCDVTTVNIQMVEPV